MWKKENVYLYKTNSKHMKMHYINVKQVLRKDKRTSSYSSRNLNEYFHVFFNNKYFE